MCSGAIPNRSAIAVVSAAAPLSGYRCTPWAASAITSSTAGSGPKGDSLEDSLWERPSGPDT